MYLRCSCWFYRMQWLLLELGMKTGPSSVLAHNAGFRYVANVHCLFICFGILLLGFLVP